MFKEKHRRIQIQKQYDMHIKYCTDNVIYQSKHFDKGNNKITELRTILQRESQNS
jgi:hypothetical protein